jgi:predicted nucleotidyltransferase
MEQSRAIEHIQQLVPKLIAVYQFGSQAHGRARKDSDVDLPY